MSDSDIKIEYKTRCKCCLDNVGSKSMWEEYYKNDDREVYGEMLMECFAVTWNANEDELICDLCINRLRDAVNLKIEFLAVQELLQENIVLEDGKSFRLKYEISPSADEITQGTQNDYYEEEYLEVFKEEGNEAYTTYDIVLEDAFEENKKSSDYEETPETLEEEYSGAYDENGENDVAEENFTYFEGYEHEEYLDSFVNNEDSKSFSNNENYAPEVTLVIDTNFPKETPQKKKQRKKTPIYKLYTKEDMQKAMDAVKIHGMSMMVAAKLLGVPRKTLALRLSTEANGEKDLSQDKHTRLIKEIRNIIKYTNAIPYKTKATKYYCAYCSTDGEMFEDPDHLREHTKTKHAKDLLRLIEHIMRPPSLNEILKMDITDLQCKICNKKIEDWNTMFIHFAEVHDMEFDEAYTKLIPYSLTPDLKCVLCNESFMYYAKLDVHMNAHYCNYICYECGDPFLSSMRLDVHLRMHRIGKFPCNLCGKVFTFEKSRTRHLIRVHKQIYNANCLYCDEKFQNALLRHRHERKHHPDKLKLFTCEFCDKYFTWKPYLLAHKKKAHSGIKKHTVKKDFVCGMCSKSFKKLLNLKEHWKTHKEYRMLL